MPVDNKVTVLGLVGALFTLISNMIFQAIFKQPDAMQTQLVKLLELVIEKNLVKTGVEEPIAGTVLTNAQLKQLEKFRIGDHKVKHYLSKVIDRSVFEQILNRSKSKIVWDSLKCKFGGNDRVKKSMLNALRREFEVLEMTDTETITKYFARIMALANKMRSNKENMLDSKVVEKILRTLTARFTYVVVSIEESQDTEAMSIDELQSSLVIHEQKFKRVNQDDEQVLALESNRGRGKGSYRGCERGRGRQSFSKAIVECFKCHNLELDETEELLLMATVDTRANRNVAWFLDLGCSNHMCGDKGVFVEMVSEVKHFAKCGNNSRMTIVGIGSVRLVFNGTAFLIQNVYYVLEPHKNLLSMGQLQETKA
ncbi:hypothetical protein CR513_49745, partial [Mucuna pruriens]